MYYKNLKKNAFKILKNWYQQWFHHPYYCVLCKPKMSKKR